MSGNEDVWDRICNLHPNFAVRGFLYCSTETQHTCSCCNVIGLSWPDMRTQFCTNSETTNSEKSLVFTKE